MTDGKTMTRAEVRRTLASSADATRLPLVATLTRLACDGTLETPEVFEALAMYLFDRTGGAMLATSDARARWLDGALFTWVGPGNAVPIDDAIAALIVAPALVRDDQLVATVRDRRFAPRADEAIAVALAGLPAAARQRELAVLAGRAGPEEEVLGLSALQCGRALAWSPQLADSSVGDMVFARLCALFARDRPRPLVELVARALGPIARAGGSLAIRVRDLALAAIDAAEPEVFASFADEVRALATPRHVPELARWRAEPARELAAAAAYVLGFAAPQGREAFVAHRALVLDRPSAAALDLPGRFVDGLVAAAHVDALTELAAQLFAEDREVEALALAARLPLDALASAIVGELDGPSEARRVGACAACELLAADSQVDDALVLRLSDPASDVAAAAARALDARGQRTRVADHVARESSPIRRAIARATCDDVDLATVSELAREVMSADHVSPLVALVATSLFAGPSDDHLALAGELVASLPEIAGVLAIAVAEAAERDVGVLAPPASRAALAAAALGVARAPEHAGGELAALALYLLARVSAQDVTVAEIVAQALATTSDQAASLVAALGELRVANGATANALAPLVAPAQPIGSRVLAASVCGRALPRDHAAWVHIRELAELGTIARAAAWTALRDRERRAV